MLVKVSAPGSLMLLGEYAVLHGKQALVCAVNKRMTVTLEPREDNQIEIHSQTLGSFITERSRLAITAPFQFVTAALERFQEQMTSGCRITIESEFSHQIGFGSSASVTVATLAALARWLGVEWSSAELIREARAIVKKVQGTGSGADVAACVLGGMVAYKTEPMTAEKITTQHPLTVIYSGYKTKTADAIQKVQAQFATQPDLFEKLCQAIQTCAVQGIDAARKSDWASLGNAMNVQQGLMESLGVSTHLLSSIVNVLREQPTMLGAKISGSGLGDCLVGLGHVDRFTFPDEKVQWIPVEMTGQGVQYEKN